MRFPSKCKQKEENHSKEKKVEIERKPGEKGLPPSSFSHGPFNRRRPLHNLSHPQTEVSSKFSLEKKSPSKVRWKATFWEGKAFFQLGTFPPGSFITSYLHAYQSVRDKNDGSETNSVFLSRLHFLLLYLSLCVTRSGRVVCCDLNIW